ncbi:hypothetical protein EXE48_13570 [Halorubrum sp. ASP1]|jgi:hypothetical protein|uniref:hypothetical protein n=1 Tax=Halorubrum sp. ASP1 TaxID=2518114 RepID=UPI0010F98276|nr:hypothetical protein [Halorubrum sp. ASP1]TKX59797.1 hypothetical protein EXE48_13570 [Halorubrum sp. ASP1]
MGGFKEGTVNGWDDEEEEEDADSGPEFEEETVGNEDGSPEERSTEVEIETETDDTVESGTNSTSAREIPWVLRRNSITDGRDQTVQLHLQEETMNVQRKQKSLIEARLGESVRKADLREAALLVGLQHTDDVVDVLQEWGYNLE